MGKACVWNIIKARHGIKVFVFLLFIFYFVMRYAIFTCFCRHYLSLLLLWWLFKKKKNFMYLRFICWGRFHVMMMFVNCQILHWWGVAFLLVFLGAKNCMLIWVLFTQSTIINISTCLITLMHQPLHKSPAFEFKFIHNFHWLSCPFPTLCNLLHQPVTFTPFFSSPSGHLISIFSW